MKVSFIALFAIAISLIYSCNNAEKTGTGTDNKATEAEKSAMIAEENVTYSAGGVNMNGFISYDSAMEGKRPIVMVIHEWWGLNDYVKMRARELARLGYLAMAVDMFGNGKQADNPDSAGKLAGPFYADPQMAKARFDAGLQYIMQNSLADTSKVAAIGYCFGGGMALNIARLGENLDGVVSFHGNLVGTSANKDLLKAKILVCHGAADPFVPQAEVDKFKKQMDSIGANYTFKAYDSATHACTNPNATATGQKYNIPIAYNAKADSASWEDMKQFFRIIFDQNSQN